MTPKEFATALRNRTKTDSTILTDTDIKLYLNTNLEKLAFRIGKHTQGEYFGAIATTDIEDNKREYPLPNDYMGMIRVEANLLNESAGQDNWVKLKPLQSLLVYERTQREDEIINKFSNSFNHAFYDIYRKSLWLYTATVYEAIGGLKLWYFHKPADITDLTLEVDMSIDPNSTNTGIPTSFHKILLLMCSRDWKLSGDKLTQLAEDETDVSIEAETRMALENISSVNVDEQEGYITPRDPWGSGFDL